jgi:glycosyltransferase involved in cell wall biosynthesis
MGDVETVAVTVVIPVSSQQNILWRALMSAQRQEPAPAEIIVVDDASSDDSADIAEEFGAKVIRMTTPKGVNACRNAGLQAASQPWITFLDAGDEWTPGHLARVSAYFPHYQLVAEATLVPPVGTEPPRKLGNPERDSRSLLLPFDVTRPGQRITASATVLNTAIARDAGGFGVDDLAGDMDFWFRFIERAPGLALGTPGVICHDYADDRRAVRAAQLATVDNYRERNWLWQQYRSPFAAQLQLEALHESLRSDRFTDTLRSLAYLVRRKSEWRAVREQIVCNWTARRSARKEWKHIEQQVVDLRDIALSNAH